jgi:monomeric sarcosine oxidase
MPALRVAVVGSGAFGVWTALSLVRRGAAVTLIDAWGPGNARASSGGATRVIRATYGRQAIYTRMAIHALRRWQEYEARWRAGLLRQTGALWLFGRDAAFGETSLATLSEAAVTIDEMTVPEASRRYPQVAFDDVSRVLFEPAAGYLFASRACQHVAQRVVAEGGRYQQAAAMSPAVVSDRGLLLTDGSTLSADRFVFACGPWLGSLFSDVIGPLVTPTRQEVYYFGLPAGDPRFSSPSLPVWLECSESFVYGIPADDGAGLKIADDTSGPAIDPTSDERLPTEAGIVNARRLLERRFPAMRDQPLVRSEVCQYEATPDSHFIVDRHPGDARIVIAGGGSGHGFKMGPAIGEIVTSLVLDEAEPDGAFQLSRFADTPADGWPAKWS